MNLPTDEEFEEFEYENYNCNKQQKFNSIFNDSNINEIIWYYKFNENNSYIYNENKYIQQFNIIYEKSRRYMCLCPYTIEDYKNLQERVQPFDNFKNIITEIHNKLCIKLSTSLKDFKKIIYFYIKDFTNETNYKKLKIGECGSKLGEFLKSILNVYLIRKIDDNIIDKLIYTRTQKQFIEVMHRFYQKTILNNKEKYMNVSNEYVKNFIL